MKLSNQDIDAYNSILDGFKEPKTVMEHIKTSGASINARVIKLCREGFLEIVGHDIHPKYGYKICIYKTVIDHYSVKQEEQPLDFGSSWLNKMFGVTDKRPPEGRFVKEKNIKRKPRKSEKNFVAGSTLSMAI